ncbi:TPA: hypothetical protein N0F65_007568 [Lagenidium giganteum]|uniref:Uncharacterized protein n=1 Tax=Lagenidium giganteum TaxID=4803 RepID=A0AAV2ZHV2_9STRA|nr:TPA: hypothetical protein N0F65_007568 [Lagenidium giganteum]
MKIAAILATVALATSAVQAGNNQTAITPAKTPIRFTRLVGPNAACRSFRGKIAMCATKDYVCRMPKSQMAAANQPKCLPLEADSTDYATQLLLQSAAPWATCNPAKVNVNRPLCRSDFVCQCSDPANNDSCACMPPDTTPSFAQDRNTACGETRAVCAENEYCHWVSAEKQECGPKPYFQAL